MTTEENTTHVFGAVTSIEFKSDKNGKAFATVSIVQTFSDGTPFRYPTRIRTRDAGLLERLEKAQGHLAQGVSIEMGCDVRETPREEGGFWRDMLAITHASVGGAGQAPPGTPPGTPTGTPTAPASSPAQGNSGFSLDERIAWNSAINNAIAMYVPLIKHARPKSYLSEVNDLAGRIYLMIRQGPPQGNVAEKPQEAPEDTPATEMVPEDPLEDQGPPPADDDGPDDGDGAEVQVYPT